MNRHEYQQKLFGVFQQAAVGPLATRVEYDDEKNPTFVVFYDAESREIHLKIKWATFEKSTANDIVEMLGGKL